MKKRIFWILGYPGLIESGVSLYSYSFIQSLRMRGWEIKICLGPKNKKLELMHRLFCLPIQVLFLSCLGNIIIVKDESYTFLAPFTRKKLIVILHHLRSHDTLLAKSRYKIRLVVDHFFKYFSKNVKKIIAVSEHTCKSLVIKNKFLFNSTSVIYNPLNIERFKLCTISKEILFAQFNISFSSNLKYFLYVGSEEPRKNFKTLLLVLSELKNDSIRFIKVGDPIYEENRAEHLKMIEELGLEDKIYFVGKVTFEELISFYHAVDLFVFPSLFEGFGRPPVEAQACGCPVISTHGGALKEVLGNSCMVVQDPLNVDEWVDKINMMLNSSREEWAQKGYENVKRFDINHLTDLWEEVLSN